MSNVLERGWAVVKYDISISKLLFMSILKLIDDSCEVKVDVGNNLKVNL